MGLKKSLGLVAQTGYYLKESWKPDACVPSLQEGWAKETLERFNIQLQITGRVSEDKPLLLVGNHISYLDIAILMAAVPSVSFVAKKEVGKWPVFGPAAKAMNTIFVDRGCGKSRSSARESLKEGLKSGKRVVVFPSGTTCLDESKEWRYGAFEVAKELNVSVQPFRLTYSPLRLSAYIHKDFFPWHLFQLARAGKITARLEFASPLKLENAREDCASLQKWTRQFVASEGEKIHAAAATGELVTR